jgi:hypothetical protein
VLWLIAGLAGTAAALYALDRLLKARSQARRLRRMSERLAAATARAEEQHEQRQATARASAALTSVMPAIERPPLTLPGQRGGPAAPAGHGARQGHPLRS